jgi:dipeptidyl aminopeptidase/acylaminoacyl peptidase
VSRRPGIFRWAFVSVALALTVCLVPGSPGAMELFLSIRLPLIIPRIPSVPLNERVLRIPMSLSRPSDAPRFTLEATLYRPAGPGPFPLVVISHGTPRDSRQRAGPRLRYNAQSWKFVSMGFAVVIPMRRGYGHSEGEYAEGDGPCNCSQFYEAGLESARDLKATMDYVSTLPGIDTHRLVLVG